MTIHVLVEGASELALFERWAPRLLGRRPIKIHPHQGKGKLPDNLDAAPKTYARGLLDQLPAKLRGFARSIDLDVDRILVLVDADSDDATILTQMISRTIQHVSPGLQVAIHLAIEETEAFYLGDLHALERAFPDADMKTARAYKADSICNTWELFGKIVNDGGGNKVAWAEAMGPVLTTKESTTRSPSFKKLIKGLRAAAAVRQSATTSGRPYRHPPRNRGDSSGKRP